MGRRIGFEGVGLLDLAAAAWDMHFGLPDLNVRKLGSSFFENRIVGLAGLAGGQPIGHDCTGAIGEFFVVGVADVENSTHGWAGCFLSVWSAESQGMAQLSTPTQDDN